MNQPHIICEVANVHGGSPEYIKELITKFSTIDYDNLGIKFQVFKYDLISMSDFPYFNIYKELFIDEDTWKDIFALAKTKFKKTWIDIFDLYGVEFLKSNMKLVDGIKLQSSVLDNYEIFSALKTLDLSQTALVINVSGNEISQIEQILLEFKQLNPLFLCIQLGFQVFPSQSKDISINKIRTIKACFPELKLSYADHWDADIKYSQFLPGVLMNLSIDIIEKHICLERKSAKYDGYSSLELDEFNNLLGFIKELTIMNEQGFITETEKIYLSNSIQKPIIKKSLFSGQLISKSDLYYRRTSLDGLTWNQINTFQKQFYIVDHDLKENTAINLSNLKSANIAVIIAGRMKSSRLKKKAHALINEVPSIEMCINSCKKIKSASKVILASSTLEDDAVLEQNAINCNVPFWKGDPNDVIKRYIGAIDNHKIDVFIRVTADCPIVSAELAEILLKSHFENGADYTAAYDGAVGSLCEIYNSEAIKRVIKIKGEAEYSEYMTWYMRNNSDIFKVNLINLDEKYLRNYRLTLDYEEDLIMFNKLFEKLNEQKLDSSLLNVFKILDENPEIAAINNNIGLVYKTDQKLIDLLNEKTRLKNAI